MCLKSKNLLVIAPNTHDIINDQLQLLSQYFSKTSVIVPLSYFSEIALNLPYFKRYFEFMRINLQVNEQKNYDVVYSKFFTLPLEILRKRNCFLESESCIKTIMRRRMDFGLIHAHFLYTGFVGASLKELYDKPFVVTAHGGDIYDLPFRNRWNNDLARYILSKADQIITVSRSNEQKLTSLGVPSNKLKVIPNGYCESLFRPISSDAVRIKLGLPLNKRIILSVGNLVEIKGHSFLIDAMNIIRKKRDDVILIIVGSGRLHVALQKKIRNLNLNQKVILVGRKNHYEIPLWMNASDIFVLPSLGEGFPTVIPEALACGKPVIGTYVGGVPEVLSNPNVGVLVNSSDSQSLADAILASLDKKWISDSIQNYSKQFAWTSVVKKILEVYKHV